MDFQISDSSGELDSKMMFSNVFCAFLKFPVVKIS